MFVYWSVLQCFFVTLLCRIFLLKQYTSLISFLNVQLVLGNKKALNDDDNFFLCESSATRLMNNARPVCDAPTDACVVCAHEEPQNHTADCRRQPTRLLARESTDGVGVWSECSVHALGAPAHSGSSRNLQVASVECERPTHRAGSIAGE